MKEKKTLTSAEQRLAKKRLKIAREGRPKVIRVKKPDTRKYDPWRDD